MAAAEEFHLTEAQAAATRQGFNFCPMCGAEMETRHVFGQNRRVCPNPECHFVQFLDPKLTTAVFAEKDGKILLVKRTMNPGKGSWCFPGGFMEMNESPQASAIRECKEETGYDVEITGLLDVFYYHDYRGSGVAIMYRGTIVGGSAAHSPVEVEAVGLFGPDELPEPIVFESNLQTLAAWRAGKL